MFTHAACGDGRPNLAGAPMNQHLISAQIKLISPQNISTTNPESSIFDTS